MADSRYTLNIVDLPEDVLLEIFVYLSDEDLLNIGSLSTRFEDIVDCRKLITRLDIRHIPMTPKKLLSYKNIFSFQIQSLFMRMGFQTIKEDLARSLAICENLTILALENITINRQQLQLKFFPKQLEELSLKNSHIEDGSAFFWNAKEYLPKLHTLIVDGCEWITGTSIFRILRLPLRNLSIRLQHPKVLTRSLLRSFHFSSLCRLDITLAENETRDVLACLLRLPYIIELYVEQMKPNRFRKNTHCIVPTTVDTGDNELFTNRYSICEGKREFIPVCLSSRRITPQVEPSVGMVNPTS